MTTSQADEKFNRVELEALHEGMLVERPLHIFLPANGRYVMLVRALQPLEATALAKFRKLGAAFASGPDATLIYPRLEESAAAVRAVCENDELAPFEKNRDIRAATEWLVNHVLGQARDPQAAPLFVHRAFGLPQPETLLFVSDASVEAYERGLAVASASAVLALWLGYTDVTFLRQFIETVFVSDVGVAGAAPGTGEPDFRFSQLDVAGADNELAEIVAFTRELLGCASSLTAHPRVARKLGRLFRLARIDVPGKAAA